MKTSIILLIILSIQFGVMLDLSNYSIDTLLNFLEDSGIFDILKEIKLYFGYDVSIAMCKEFVKSNHCEIIIKTYIPNGSRPDDILTIFSLEHLLMKPENYQILSKYYERPGLLNMASKVKKLYPKEF